MHLEMKTTMTVQNCRLWRRRASSLPDWQARRLHHKIALRPAHHWAAIVRRRPLRGLVPPDEPCAAHPHECLISGRADYKTSVRPDPKRRPGVTLMEILVVISIIGMLMALLLPAVQVARESGRRMQCQDHLRQQGLALLNHESAHGRLPSNGWGYRWVGDPDRGTGAGQPGSWIYSILPYLERADLRRLGTGLPAAKKRQALAQLQQYPLTMFNCPSRRPLTLWPQLWWPFNTDQVVASAKSDYAVNGGDVYLDVGEGPRTLAQGDDAHYQWPKADFTGVSYLRSQVTMAHIRDGKSQTYLAGEKNLPGTLFEVGADRGDDQSMYSGDDFDTARWTPLGWTPLTDWHADMGFGRFGGPHPSGCNFVFCDGSVRAIGYAIDAEIHRRLGNRQDQEVIDDALLR